jgi:hypothetical protein
MYYSVMHWVALRIRPGRRLHIFKIIIPCLQELCISESTVHILKCGRSVDGISLGSLLKW